MIADQQQLGSGGGHMSVNRGKVNGRCHGRFIDHH
jgi:hypothetical protein